MAVPFLKRSFEVWGREKIQKKRRGRKNFFLKKLPSSGQNFLLMAERSKNTRDTTHYPRAHKQHAEEREKREREEREERERERFYFFPNER